MDDPLDPEARALWRRVTETVRPLGRRPLAQKLPLSDGERVEVRGSEAKPRVTPSASATLIPTLSLKGEGVKKVATPANTLDASWDRRLARGIVSPDMTIDLHGHTVAAAHFALEAGLAQAVARHARLVLLVTGRPPPPGRSRLDNPLRGVIRASIGDWLHHSRHASHIAAVRNAHPRHGGTGALYVILRRARL